MNYNLTNIFNDNSFNGYYVDSYNQVESMAVPSNGTATIFVNLNDGKLWSKKILNNCAYVQEYEIKPVTKIGTPEDNMKEVLDQLKALKDEINILKGEQKHD